MTPTTQHRSTGLASRLVLPLTLALALAFGVLAAAPAPVAQADPGVVVSPTPDARAPRVTNGRVYAIDSHGPLVAVGGSFTTLRAGSGGADIPRQWLFIYNSQTGQVSSTFVPQLTGPAPAPTAGMVKDQPGVEAVQFAPDGQSLYVGGWFTAANGVAKNRLVRLALDGSVISSFQADANNVVNDLQLTGNRLIVGGKFGRVNGQPVERLVSLDPTTGATQTDFNLPASGSRNQYGGYVNELDVSDNGRWLVVSGSFRQVGTAPRNQLALIDLTGTPSVADWSTDLYTPNCSASSTDSGSYIRGLSISPDSSYLVVSTTGAFVGTETMCDAAARFELPPTSSGDDQKWTWRAKTGGDTLWAAKVTDDAVYVGGHQRWLNNPRPTPGGDNDGPGSVVRAGIAALDPLTGVPLSWNPGRDRGRGAEAIHADDQYLYVGHDTDLWGGAVRQRLAQLPFAGGKNNPEPVDVDLPAKLWFTDGSALTTAPFDGATVGAPSVVNSPATGGDDWSTNRGGFVQDGKLHYFGAAQAFWSRPFSDGTVGAPTNLSNSVGYVDTNYDSTPYDQPYGVAETTAATYSNGQIYYLKSGDPKLYHRGYSLESGIVEGSEYVAAGQDFSGARGLAMIGDWLYAAWSDGRLYRFHAPDGQVSYASRTVVDEGTTVDWEDVRGFWATPGTGSAVDPTPPGAVTCADGTPWKASYWPNMTLTGAPSTTRCEASVDYTWGTAAPAGAGVPGDSFSASWTRTVNLTAAGAIAVTAQADDGIRVYVDGKRVIDAWRDGSGTSTGTSGALAAGDHQVRVEYYERSGAATARIATSVVAAPPPAAGPDNQPGDTTLTAPAASVTGPPPVAVTAAGGATDNVGVTAVRVAVQDRTSLQWLQTNGTWGPAFAVRTATLASPGATSTTWSLGVPLPHGSFAVEARALDAAGNEDPTAARRLFTVSGPAAPADTTAPTVAVGGPTKNGSVAAAAVTATGTTQDGVAVGSVRVAVYDRAAGVTNRWLQADGSWGSAYAYRTATLAAPGTPSSGWSLGLNLPDGLYALDVKGVDGAGNVSASVWHPFTVNAPSGDTVAPRATLKKRDAVVKGRQLRLAGAVTDDKAMGRVLVAISRTTAGTRQWLQADGRWDVVQSFRSAKLASVRRSTGWTFALRLARGTYQVQVISTDRTANVQRSTVSRTVRVTAG